MVLKPRQVSLKVSIYIYNRFFKNQPNEICSHSSEKASKGRFLKPEKLQTHRNEEEGKEEKRKKATVALLVFIVATLEKKTVGRKRSIWR